MRFAEGGLPDYASGGNAGGVTPVHAGEQRDGGRFERLRSPKQQSSGECADRARAVSRSRGVARGLQR
jgi:hypothetical protein